MPAAVDTRVDPPRHPRTAMVTGTVVLLHVGALWALQTGLLRRAADTAVPVVMLAETVTPAVPQPAPEIRPAAVPRRAQARPAARAAATPPVPAAVPDAAPAPDAPTGVRSPPAPAPVDGPLVVAAAPTAPPAPPAPPRLELPSSDAAYLQNPRPAYPPASRRLGEQGRVLLRVLIGTDGTAHQAELHQSSGHDRLDQAALETVRKWRYVPGKRAGVPEAMWFQVPINFVLE